MRSKLRAFLAMAAAAAVLTPALIFASESTPSFASTAVTAAKKPTAAEVKAGKSIFATECSSCHGMKGTGTSAGPNLKKEPRAKSVSGVIKQLNKPLGAMPSFKSKLSAKQKKAVAAYVTVDISKAVK